MTSNEATTMILALTTLGVRARVEERYSTNEDGSRNVATSVVASLRDSAGNSVVREWTSAPADLAKEIGAMRKELKAASKLTATRVAAERGSR